MKMVETVEIKIENLVRWELVVFCFHRAFSVTSGEQFFKYE